MADNRMLEFILGGHVLAEESENFADEDGDTGPTEDTPQSSDSVETRESTKREAMMGREYPNSMNRGQQFNRHSSKPREMPPRKIPHECPHCGHKSQGVSKSCPQCGMPQVYEGIEKVKGGYENIGKTGKKHSKKPMTKKKARAQQKAMFYNGFEENAALEAEEERLHKDLDHDGEKGESKAHRAKVLQKEGYGALPPADNHRSRYRPEVPDTNPHEGEGGPLNWDETPEMGQEHPGNNEFGESGSYRFGTPPLSDKEINAPSLRFSKGSSHEETDTEDHLRNPKTGDTVEPKKESLDLNILIRKMVERGLTNAQIKYVLRTQFPEARNAYAVGMAAAEKETGDTPPLKKSTIEKGHEIAKAIKRKKK